MFVMRGPWRQASHAMLAAIVVWLALVPPVDSDDRAYSLDYRGIPAPYCFAARCQFSDAIWSAGGDGQVLLLRLDGQSQWRPTRVDLKDISFVDPSTGWVVGVKGTILHTADAGKSWQTQAAGTTDDLQAVICVDVDHCWIAGLYGAVLRTMDGGANWVEVSVPARTSFDIVHFVDLRNGWLASSDGLVAYTNDGGDEWRLLEGKPLKGVDNVTDIHFLSGMTGWAAGSGGLARTTDGGRSWTFALPEESFVGVVSHDGRTVWAVPRNYGKREGNYLSEDGGVRWRFVDRSPRSK